MRRDLSLLGESGEVLVRKINEPPAVTRPGSGDPWCGSRRPYEPYLSNIRFRDVRAGSYRRR